MSNFSTQPKIAEKQLNFCLFSLDSIKFLVYTLDHQRSLSRECFSALSVIGIG